MTSAALPLSGSLSSTPTSLLVAIALLGALELALDVFAFVVLVRTPRDRVTLPKWAWALLIIFINLIGAILFLAIGRRPAPADDPRPVHELGARPSPSSVADSLYGSAPSAAPPAGATPPSTDAQASNGGASATGDDQGRR